MANKLDGFLGNMLQGFLDPKGNLGDYQHAARLYVDDTFRLAPKTKFLYYAVFNINQSAMQDVSFQDRHQLELNYLVKSMDLPKYTIDTTNLNQYNRKTNIYTKITYDPINITLHDDNNGITNSLWALYYGYYFADRLNSSDPYSTVAPEAYMRNTYDPKETMPYRYGLDNESLEPFFNSIQLFVLSRQRFFSYMLCNPKITKWEHDNMSQNESNGIVENKMTLAYDAVIYNSGVVDANAEDPAGFAVLHYDNTPSPIVDEEILQGGIEGIFGDLFGLSSFSGPNTYLSSRSATPYLNLGNQASYGFGTPPYYGNQGGYGYSGGLSGYGFGSNNLSTGLTIAGIGLAARGIGAVVNGVGNLFSSNSGAPISQNNNSSANTDQAAGINNQYAGVTNPNSNGNSANAVDANASQLPGGLSTGTAVGSAVGDQGPVVPGAGNAQAVSFSGNTQGVSGAGIGALGNTSTGSFGLGGVTSGTSGALGDAKKADAESSASGGFNTVQTGDGPTQIPSGDGSTSVVDQQPTPDPEPSTELADNSSSSDWGYSFGA